ncbi:Polyphosphoinositide phosphatase [Escovopsis weberi]|uniref:Polyphosphoinositide phosphatase n=1 Tax=Escovopsis weberi TaxID=150374 RepID=A0A0M8N619_ESCWE|nr:Polyphosphoinositide phosphatase [Escovopsis weberi]
MAEPPISYASSQAATSHQGSLKSTEKEESLATFPLLQNNEAAGPFPDGAGGGGGKGREGDDDDREDEPAIAKPFTRKPSPDSAAPSPDAGLAAGREKGGDTCADDGDAARRPFHKMHRYSLYETASHFYLVGVDVSEKRYRILKIEKTTEGTELNMTDDKHVYSLDEVSQLLETIDHGNRGTGGVKLRCTTWGLLGFIKFTGPYYMLLITKKSTVAMIGGHYINQIEGTELIPLTPGRTKSDARNNPEEQRFLTILNTLDLTKSFYYSYSYDITRTLQHNISRERILLSGGALPPPHEGFNSMFVWNHYLLQPAVGVLSDPYDWCRPIIHGYIDQAESMTTSFHAPGPKLYCSPQYTSYVQHRGSIPLYWTQDSTAVTPKPPIELNLVDPFYSAAALHFDNLFERYGSPVYVLNLIKAKERQPRESKLLEEYTKALEYLNQFLPEGKKIIHKAWDMSRASKMRGGDVIGNLETIAESVLKTTGFFQNGDGITSPMTAQNGVARTNCIDCLDRTNAAQFVIGKRALGHQLHALGILEDTSVEYDTDAVNLFTHMWHDHGDTIALQYGGSQLVNTMETYRKINQWTSHSRDMIESFKRYYNNSFLDSQRQEAYNLFLGNYIFTQGQPMLWDLSTDYYLHHASPREWSAQKKTNYISWFNPDHLKERKIPPFVPPRKSRRSLRVERFDDYWLEYYRPATLSSFPKMFAYKMNSTIKYIPLKATQDGRYDLSPFRVRKETDVDAEKRKMKKESADLSHLFPPQSSGASDRASFASSDAATARGMSLHRWLQPGHGRTSRAKSVSDDSIALAMDDNKLKQTALEKSNAAQWTFTKAVHEALNPSVNEQEAEDYGRYVRHPQNLPLVVTDDTPVDVDSSEFQEYQEYVNGSWQDEGLMVMGIEEEIDLYAELLKVGENPLTVTEEDAPKKRYKAYGKWLRGKSFFKQQPLD